MKLRFLVAVAIVAPSYCYDAPKPNECTKDGRFFPCGKFADPSDRCNDCECFLDGNYTCSKRVCPAVNCPVEKRMYRPGSCCAVCFDHGSKTSDSSSDIDHHTSSDKDERYRRTVAYYPGKGSSGSTTSERHTSKSSSDNPPEGYNRARRSLNIDGEADVRRFVRTIVYKPGSRTSDHHGSSSSSDGKGHQGGKSSGKSGSKSSHSSKSSNGGNGYKGGK
ncbi:uncharacterized protein LOC127857587 [Dreissena polymorpha]|uniref:uncharacterized protein LOC127857587 n=1 Tax=Dreissena polymorpha TaxID=45954 RepID=UPI002263B8AE|nr:uncharacterized protein LOC127857587 [Dreissena polymorpha]